MFDTNKMLQVAFIVRDLEKYLKNYANLLDIDMPPVSIIPPVEETRAEYNNEPMTGLAKIGYIDFANMHLEFIQPLGGPSIWQDFLDEKGEGLHHLAFETDNIKQTTLELNEKGYPMVQHGQYSDGYYTYHKSLGKLLVDLEILDEVSDAKSLD